jgi:hypothetical protein
MQEFNEENGRKQIGCFAKHAGSDDPERRWNRWNCSMDTALHNESDWPVPKLPF